MANPPPLILERGGVCGKGMGSQQDMSLPPSYPRKDSPSLMDLTLLQKYDARGQKKAVPIHSAVTFL